MPLTGAAESIGAMARGDAPDPEDRSYRGAVLRAAWQQRLGAGTLEPQVWRLHACRHQDREPVESPRNLAALLPRLRHGRLFELPMKDRSDPADYAPANDAEWRALQDNWMRGGLHTHAVRLVEFIDRHREEIIALAGPGAEAEAKLRTIKRQIVRVESVCSLSEMRDQARAIQDEIWYRGERGEYDRQHIAHEWTSRHAVAWRRWRLKEYLFVVDRCAESLLTHLDGGS